MASNENDGEIMRGNAPNNGTVPSRVRSSLSTEFKNRNIFKKKLNQNTNYKSQQKSQGLHCGIAQTRPFVLNQIIQNNQ